MISLGGGFFLLLYYISIYFQAVRNTSAANSGIRNLSLIITDSTSFYPHQPSDFDCSCLTTLPALFVIASGLGITALGYFAPFAILGSVLATVGCGMIYTWTTTSPAVGLDRLSSARWYRARLVLPSSPHGRPSSLGAGRCLFHDGLVVM